MFFSLLSLSLLVHITYADMVKLKQWNNNASHTSFISSVCIYNDNTKFVTGSNDKDLKVWSLDTFELLFSKTYADYLTYVGLHPADNRIFVVVFDGTIQVFDPINYNSLSVFNYPLSGNPTNGNFIQFFSSNSKFVISGYDDVSPPILHIYNANTYAPIAGGATTIFNNPLDEVTGLATSKDNQLLGVISNQEPPTSIKFALYSLATNTLFQEFQDNSQLLKWIVFSPNKDQFYVTSNDMTLKAYRLNSRTSKYQVAYSFSTELYGYPNCVTAKKENEIVFVANSNIIFLDISGSYPQVKFKSTDQTDIFVFDISPDGKKLVTGMRNGEVTVWQIGDPVTKKDQNLTLLIILGSVIGGFIVLALTAIIVHKCCCTSHLAIKDSSNQNNQYIKQQDKVKNINKTQISMAQYQNMENSLEIR